jgi:hypothetical protein
VGAGACLGKRESTVNAKLKVNLCDYTHIFN